MHSKDINGNHDVWKYINLASASEIGKIIILTDRIGYERWNLVIIKAFSL